MKRLGIFVVVFLSSCGVSKDPALFELGTTQQDIDTATELESTTDVRIDAGLLTPGEPASITLPLPGERATVTQVFSEATGWFSTSAATSKGLSCRSTMTSRLSTSDLWVHMTRMTKSMRRRFR